MHTGLRSKAVSSATMFFSIPKGTRPTALSQLHLPCKGLSLLVWPAAPRSHPPSLQVVSSRAFAGAFEAQDGAKVVWKFCAPLLDMLDHGGLCQLPGEEPVRRDNVRSAPFANHRDAQWPYTFDAHMMTT